MPKQVGTFYLPMLASAPGSPADGQMYFNTATDLLGIYSADRSAWMYFFPVHVGTTAPSTPKTGDRWVDTT